MNQIEFHICSFFHYVKPFLCMARKQVQRTLIRQRPCLCTLLFVCGHTEFMQIVNLQSPDLGHKLGWKLRTRKYLGLSNLINPYSFIL